MATRVTMGLTVVLMVLLMAPSLARAAVYKVGDSSGWTTIGNVDYKKWSATKNFRLGDVIIFQYNPQFHNVMQVTHAAYKACNASSPIATHTAGNDTITIKNHGHHFFLCGVPGHCQSGQKVDINVLRTTTSIAPSPSVTSTPAKPSAMAPGPSTAVAAASPVSNSLTGLLTIVVVAVVTLFVTSS